MTQCDIPILQIQQAQQYDYNSYNMTITATIRVMTPEQTAEAIKNVAKNIRETSYKMQTGVRDIS